MCEIQLRHTKINATAGIVMLRSQFEVKLLKRYLWVSLSTFFLPRLNLNLALMTLMAIHSRLMMAVLLLQNLGLAMNLQ